MKEQPPAKIKIAFVSPNAWTMYNFRREVLTSILQNGYEVLIIAEEDRCVPMLTSMGCKFLPLVINNRSLNPAEDISLFLKLKKIYKVHKPDFVFHYVIKPNIYGTIAAGLLRIPSIPVITGLGHAFNKHSLLSAFIKLLYRFSLRYAHQVWCLNNDDAGFFTKNNIVPVEKIVVLPGEGVDTDHFKKDKTFDNGSQVFTFLMSARLLKTKGILEYSQATLLLNQKNLTFQCLLIGAIEAHPDAIPETTVTSWQKTGSLHYLGFTDDVRPHLASADCFVYPSYYNEGVPRSLMEACSMQLPVITTDNTGCRELIEDGVNGFLCEKQNPQDLAAKMENMISGGTDARIVMGQKGRDIVAEKYSVKHVIAYYTDLLATFFKTPASG